jgi:hypothetical protein
VFLVLLIIAGCTGFTNQSEISIKNKSIIQGIKSWNVVYDSTSGYDKSYGTMVENEIAFTPYKDVNSVSDRPSPEYLYSDMRGKTLSTNIYQLLKDGGIMLSNDARGVINVSRPTFLNEGRYILRTTITFLDNENKVIAVVEAYNNLRKETSAKGITYKDTGDLMTDSRYASLCAEKILSVLRGDY